MFWFGFDPENPVNLSLHVLQRCAPDPNNSIILIEAQRFSGQSNSVKKHYDQRIREHVLVDSGTLSTGMPVTSQCDTQFTWWQSNWNGELPNILSGYGSDQPSSNCNYSSTKSCGDSKSLTQCYYRQSYRSIDGAYYRRTSKFSNWGQVLSLDGRCCNGRRYIGSPKHRQRRSSNNIKNKYVYSPNRFVYYDNRTHPMDFHCVHTVFSFSNIWSIS